VSNKLLKKLFTLVRDFSDLTVFYHLMRFKLLFIFNSSHTNASFYILNTNSGISTQFESGNGGISGHLIYWVWYANEG